ncbi:hypothetical protein FOA52_013949 [Chlamydomonas sp. UWO 241]|nr:hypothetical protein FOA52_013949 [Chlamydomonas sp. UWO 241]
MRGAEECTRKRAGLDQQRQAPPTGPPAHQSIAEVAVAYDTSQWFAEGGTVPVCLASLDAETRCPICYGKLKRTRMSTSCGHRYCSECIDHCMRLEIPGRSPDVHECPVCRAHVASRRSAHADEKFDFLMRAVYGDVSVYEAQQEALVEQERAAHAPEHAAQSNAMRAAALAQKQAAAAARGGGGGGARGRGADGRNGSSSSNSSRGGGRAGAGSSGGGSGGAGAGARPACDLQALVADHGRAAAAGSAAAAPTPSSAAHRSRAAAQPPPPPREAREASNGAPQPSHSHDLRAHGTGAPPPPPCGTATAAGGCGDGAANACGSACAHSHALRAHGAPPPELPPGRVADAADASGGDSGGGKEHSAALPPAGTVPAADGCGGDSCGGGGARAHSHDLRTHAAGAPPPQPPLADVAPAADLDGGGGDARAHLHDLRTHAAGAPQQPAADGGCAGGGGAACVRPAGGDLSRAGSGYSLRGGVSSRESSAGPQAQPQPQAPTGGGGGAIPRLLRSAAPSLSSGAGARVQPPPPPVSPTAGGASQRARAEGHSALPTGAAATTVFAMCALGPWGVS